MDFPNNFPALQASLTTFLINHGADLPEDTRGLLLEAVSQPAPADMLRTACDILYARKAELPREGKEVAAGFISFALAYGLVAQQRDGDVTRGGRMLAAFRRELGHKHPSGSWPARTTDPKPDDRYIRPPEMGEMKPLTPPPLPEVVNENPAAELR